MFQFKRVTHRHYGYRDGFKYFYQYPKSPGWKAPVHILRAHLKETHGDSHTYIETRDTPFRLGRHHWNGVWLDDRKRHRIYLVNESDVTLALLKYPNNTNT